MLIISIILINILFIIINIGITQLATIIVQNLNIWNYMTSNNEIEIGDILVCSDKLKRNYYLCFSIDYRYIRLINLHRCSEKLQVSKGFLLYAYRWEFFV